MVTTSKKFFFMTILAFFGLLLAGCMKSNVNVDAELSGDVADVEADAEIDAEAEDLVADVTIEVSSANFKYDPETIEVNEGDVVTINFVSTDGFHDWVVDEFDAATEKVNPGTPTSVTFVADKAGTFEFYCSVGEHRAMGMVGQLVVKASDDSDENADDSDDSEGTGDDDADDVEAEADADAEVEVDLE